MTPEDGLVEELRKLATRVAELVAEKERLWEDFCQYQDRALTAEAELAAKIKREGK